MSTPKVSVAMIAYNHEQFVEQALESVLAQKTNFDWEIVFGEDCSTDRTREIVQRIAAAHPERIRLLLPEKNLGMMRNFTSTIEACRGEYIALLEGDDFWLDPEKLQRQADQLDAHPEFSTTFCPAKTVDENGSPIEARKPVTVARPSYTLAHYFAGEFRPRTCSVMYRRGLFDRFPEWYFALPGGDYPLHLLNGQHGDFGIIDREMAAYRVHTGGVWTQGFNENNFWQAAPHAVQVKRLESILKLQATALRVVGPKFKDALNTVLRPRFVANAFRLATQHWSAGEWPQMRKALWMGIRAKPWGAGYSPIWMIEALVVSHLPFLSRSRKRSSLAAAD